MDRTIEEIQKGLNVMKFDVVVGNPPYQEAGVKDGSRDEPVYHEFIKLAYEISDKSVLITPGRFLFNAGQTPKSWNEKMLADEHLKVVHYEQNSSKIFPNTDIKGGIVVTYHDKNKIFGAIDTFTHFSELNSILGKVVTDNFESFNELLYGKSSYKLTSKIYEDFPILKGRVSIGEEKSIGSNIFDKLPEIFFSNQQNDRQIRILGRENNNRVYKWMDKSYLMDHPNFEKYKVILPASNGSGALGETLSTPLIGEPLVGYTQTFISFGSFNDDSEVQNVFKYVKSKFMRVMLGTMKITQHNQSKEVWKNVPLQDFSSNSDIDWTKSIPEIDQQLYKKYGLNQEEINFVEEKVKPME